MSNNWHAHIAKGSMKLAHSLDDRQERASMGNSASESKPIAPASISDSHIDKIRQALKARELENRKAQD